MGTGILSVPARFHRNSRNRRRPGSRSRETAGAILRGAFFGLSDGYGNRKFGDRNKPNLGILLQDDREFTETRNCITQKHIIVAFMRN